MKGDKKCYGLLLALFIMAGLSLSVCSGDTSALKHEYNSVPFLAPCLYIDDSEIIPFYDYSCSMSNPGFLLDFEGDAYDSSTSSLLPSFSNSVLWRSYDSSLNKYVYSGLSPTIGVTSRNDYLGFSTSSFYYSPNDLVINEPGQGFYTMDDFGVNGKLSFQNDSSGILNCSPYDNGAVCNGLWNTSEYISSQVLPSWISSDGFYRINSAIDTDSGIHYSYSFALADLLNGPVNKFSFLRIPLWDTDSDYFYDTDELYAGRSFEFKGAFEFRGSFNWHENIGTNGSYFRIGFYGHTVDDSIGQLSEQVFANCTTNLITLSSNGFTQLEYSCSAQLPHDLLYFLPYLEISGNQNYVWTTDDIWYFSQMFVVTDNDDTPGRDFNTHRYGGGMIVGSDEYIIDKNGSSDEDWYSSLVNLFGFNFLNPFVPLLNLFTDQSSCAQIPTIASMIHSEETQVCPWFDSTTRGITTPVLGLAGSMIVFGFAVHWLGARSGNMFEDSVDTDNYHFRSRGSRKK